MEQLVRHTTDVAQYRAGYLAGVNRTGEKSSCHWFNIGYNSGLKAASQLDREKKR